MNSTGPYEGHSGKDLCHRIEKALDGGDYERGAVEAADATARNCAGFIARLCVLLFDRKILTIEELEAIRDPGTRGYDLSGNWTWPL